MFGTAPDLTVPDLPSLLAGAVDLNLHYEAAVFDQIEAVDEASRLGLSAVVLRQDDECTAPVSSLLRSTYFRDQSIKVLGVVALNNAVGGMNPYAVEHSLMLGGRMVSMPTRSASHWLQQRDWPAAGAGPLLPHPLTVFGPRLVITDAVKEILDMLAVRDAVLCAGWLHVSEVFALFREATTRGVTRRLLSDPLQANRASIADIVELVGNGASVELQPRPNQGLPGLISALAGSEGLILGLDPGFGTSVSALLPRYEAALSFWRGSAGPDLDIGKAIGANPRRLLG